MMQAIVQDTYGSADTLRLAQLPRPGIVGHEVLLRVEAAGLDRRTWHLMTERPYLLRLGFGLRRPKNLVPGRDVAGTVVMVGSAVTRFRHVMDYTNDDFADRIHHYDLILDIAGNPALSRLRRTLTPSGRPSSSAARTAAAGRVASIGRCGPGSGRRSSGSG